MKKTVQEVAKEMLDNMEQKERQNGDKIIVTKSDIEWQKNIIHNAHGDKLPDDYCYEFIYEALCTLSDCEQGNEEEALYEIEADVYTSNLTAWLHSRCDRVYYLDEAIANGITDGFQLLAEAQRIEKQEVAQAVLQGIKEYIEEN